MINRENTVSPRDCLALFCYYRWKTGEHIKAEQLLVTSGLIDEYNSQQTKYGDKWPYFLFQYVQSKGRISSFAGFQVTREIAAVYEEVVQAWEKAPEKYSKPVIWDDRGHTEYFNDQLADAHRFEVYIEEYFRQKYHLDIGFYDGKKQYEGESSLGIEIKNDKMYRKTGNIYIEYAERMYVSEPFVESGIKKRDNTKYFICGVEEAFYIFRKETLLQLYCALEQGRLSERLRRVGNDTSRGFIIYNKYISQYTITEDTLVRELGCTE